MIKNPAPDKNINAPQDCSIVAPPNRTKWESFKIFIWNGETKEFLGRTAGNWVKIQLFYTALYAFLAGFFAVLMLVFFQTLDLQVPKWQNANGLIGSNPGLGFRPMPSKENVDSPTIKFKSGTRGDWEFWTGELEDFLDPYGSPNNSDGHVTDCNFNSWPAEGEVCNFDITLLGNQCTKEKNFGYEIGQPCIIIKLNRVYGWIPELYNDPDDLPDTMPEDLKEYIKTKAAKNKDQLNMIWLSCEGENSVDRENMGDLTYTPYRGFPAYYYPYKHIPGYLSPIVALQFKDPKAGELIKVECKAWAKDLTQDRQRGLGSVRFELLIE